MTVTKQDIDIIRKLGNVRSSSHDPDRTVGVIITDAQGNVIESDSNRPPERFGFSVDDTHAAIRSDASWKYHMLEHAERNAIMEALKNRISLEGATMYGTLFPCADCARAIVNAGIERLVIPAPGLQSPRDQKWQEHYKYAQQIFDLGGVKVDLYDPANPEIE